MSALVRVAPLSAPSRIPAAFAADVLEGLKSDPKYLSAKYFYDSTGSRLFERITQLPEYYPTRTELGILNAHAGEIAQRFPARAALIEFGSGSSMKASILLGAAPHLAAYVPVDISSELLHYEAHGLRHAFPKLAVIPVDADFSQSFDLPAEVTMLPRAGFFPGSTIGNFEPNDAKDFLQNAGRTLGHGAAFVIGVDLVKDAAVLHAAYNDAAGITAKFNLNVLARINRELGANFNLKCFEHRAFFNRAHSRIEMHLASLERQRVTICGETIEFRAGETIHTENSYKYTIESFGALARESGWHVNAVWTDAERYFAVYALVNGDEPGEARR
jgi:L-histidine N-alpha-methyltransferase